MTAGVDVFAVWIIFCSLLCLSVNVHIWVNILVLIGVPKCWRYTFSSSGGQLSCIWIDNVEIWYSRQIGQWVPIATIVFNIEFWVFHPFSELCHPRHYPILMAYSFICRLSCGRLRVRAWTCFIDCGMETFMITLFYDLCAWLYCLMCIFFGFYVNIGP